MLVSYPDSTHSVSVLAGVMGEGVMGGGRNGSGRNGNKPHLWVHQHEDVPRGAKVVPGKLRQWIL